MKSLKAKIISAAISIACIATLIGFGMTSFAWFTDNKDTDSNGLTISSIVQQSVDIIDDHFKVYYFNVEQDQAVEAEDDFILAPYNMFVPARNAYNRKFVRMSLRYPGNATGGQKLLLTLTCTGDLFKDDGMTEEEVISNLIQFRFYDNYEGSIRTVGDNVTVQNVYEDCVSVFDKIEQKTTFVSIDSEGVATKSAKVIALTVEMPSLKDKTTQLISDFFMEIDYSETLIEYFKSHGAYNFDLSYFQDGSEVEFREDIETIDLSITE